MKASQKKQQKKKTQTDKNEKLPAKIDTPQEASIQLPKPPAVSKLNSKVLNSQQISNFITFKPEIFETTGIHFTKKLNTSESLPRLDTNVKNSLSSKRNTLDTIQTTRPTSRKHYTSDISVIANDSRFFPFYNLVPENKNLHDKILNFELQTDSKSNFVNFQLKYNRSQKDLYTKTITGFQDQAYTYVLDKYIYEKRKQDKINSKVHVFLNTEKHNKIEKINLMPSIVFTQNIEEVAPDQKNQSNKASIASSNTSHQINAAPTMRTKIYATVIENHYWKPGARESTSFIKVRLKNGFFGMLFSGLSHCLHEDLCFYDFSKNIWIKSSYKGENMIFYGRFGHSISAYKNHCILFGGSLLYNNASRSMECLNEVVAINPETKFLKCLKTTGEIIEGRYGHISEVVGNFLITHGGINMKGNYLSDIKILSLDNFKWSSAIYDDNNEYLGVAFHSSCYISKTEKKYVTLYQEEAIKKTTLSQTNEEIINKYDYEGIYVFGGLNEESKILSNLRILKLGCKPLVWEFPECKGKQPEPRYKHTMTFIRPSNSIFIYGGRNDFINPGFLADGHMLDLTLMTWITCRIFGSKLDPRSSHCAAYNGSSIYIFGGINQKGYCSYDTIILELDQSKFRDKMLEEKYNLDKQIKKELPMNKQVILENASMRTSEVFEAQNELETRASLAENQSNQQKLIEKKRETRAFISLKPAPVDESDLTEQQKLRKLKIIRSTSKIYQKKQWQQTHTDKQKLFKFYLKQSQAYLIIQKKTQVCQQGMLRQLSFNCNKKNNQFKSIYQTLIFFLSIAQQILFQQYLSFIIIFNNKTF